MLVRSLSTSSKYQGVRDIYISRAACPASPGLQVLRYLESITPPCEEARTITTPQKGYACVLEERGGKKSIRRNV
jgi:hypothetical protein